MKKKLLIFTPIVISAIAAITLFLTLLILPACNSSSNSGIFKLKNVSGLYGKTESEVVAVLGEPCEKDKNIYLWYENNVDKKLKQIEKKENELMNMDENMSEDAFEKIVKQLDKMYNELSKMRYNLIMVEFGTGKVATEVFYDAKHEYNMLGEVYPKNGKTLSAVELAGEVELSGYISIDSESVSTFKTLNEKFDNVSYKAFYSDGSFYQSAINSYNKTVAEDGKSVDYTWYDVMGNEVKKTVKAEIKYTVDKGNLIIPDGTKEIKKEQFKNNTEITKVTIPDSVTSIGYRAFLDCSRLTNVTISNNVTNISESAFDGCPIETAVIPASAGKSINNAHLKTVTITSGTKIFAATIIDNSAFYNCSNLTSITISNDVTNISDSAFRGCSSLTSIAIPNSVTVIGDNAFRGCSGLTSITIPNSVKLIGDSAFEGCSGLTSITIPNSVTSIDYRAFEGCSGIIQTENSVKYVDKWIIDCDDSVTKVSLRNDTFGIATYAFSYCRGLTSITIPDSVTSIGFHAFGGCSGLTNVTGGNGVTKWGLDPFFDCPIETAVISNSLCSCINTANLKVVTITSGTAIIARTFYKCSSLTSITIPDSVKFINDSAFHGCSGLINITFNGTKEQWKAIKKGTDWNKETDNYTVTCTDGKLDKNGKEIR